MTRSTFYIDQVGHESNEDNDEKRVVKDLWNIFLRKKQKRVGSFIDRLNRYSAVVFEKRTSVYDDFITNCYFLEEKWTDVVDETISYTKKQRLQQQAIWEFFVTERNYIKKLRVIVEVFQQYFKLCQSEGDLLEINQSHLFANISEVLLSNDNLWTKHLIYVLSKSRESKEMIKPSLLLASFNQLESLFRPYINFCLHQDGCLKYLRDLTEPSMELKNDKFKNFKDYLSWCETLPQCERFKLRDLMTEPMQRMTRYPLLLKKIRKETEDESEKLIVSEMIKKAETFVSDINRTLRQRFESEKLETCLQQFEYYTISKAASEEVKWTAIEFLKTNIQCLPTEEPRCLLKRGSMKILDKKGRGDMDIVALLFTDVLVLTKLKRSTNQLQIIRQLFFLDKITLVKSQSSSDGIVFIYLDEYGLLASTFMLEVSENERDTWIATIERAKVRYENARAGEGSTLDFFNDDYYVPVIDNSNIDLKDTQAQFRSHAHYESTIDRVESQRREHTNLVTEKTATFRKDFNHREKTYSRPVSRIHSAPEDTMKSWVLGGIKRKSLPNDIESNASESFRSNKSDSDVKNINRELSDTLRTYRSIPEISLHHSESENNNFQIEHKNIHLENHIDFESSAKNNENDTKINLFSVGNDTPDPLYEEIDNFLKSSKKDTELTRTDSKLSHDSNCSFDINNNKSLRHVFMDRRSSDLVYFKTESTQTFDLHTRTENGLQTTETNNSEESTQTDITFSSNMFALALQENYLDNT